MHAHVNSACNFPSRSKWLRHRILIIFELQYTHWFHLAIAFLAAGHAHAKLRKTVYAYALFIRLDLIWFHFNSISNYGQFNQETRFVYCSFGLSIGPEIMEHLDFLESAQSISMHCNCTMAIAILLYVETMHLIHGLFAGGCLSPFGSNMLSQ